MASRWSGSAAPIAGSCRPGRIGHAGAEHQRRARRRPWTVLNDTTIVWQRRQPGRRRAALSARRLHLELAVLAEVVVVGDRAHDAVLARLERHRRLDLLAGVRGPGAPE